MTKVRLDAGVCGMITAVSAHSEDGDAVRVTAESACPAVNKMLEDLGGEFEAFDVCMIKPGDGPFYEYAAEDFPGHAGCPVCAGIAKCAEAECHMALKKDVSIRFLKEE